MLAGSTFNRVWKVIRGQGSGVIGGWIVGHILDAICGYLPKGVARIMGSFLSSPYASFWFIGAGMFFGFLWAAWPDIASIIAVPSLLTWKIGKPRLLRSAGLALAAEIRKLVDTLPKKMTQDQECERLFWPSARIFPRVYDFRDRARNVLKQPRALSFSTDWCVPTKDHMRWIADAVEQCAVDIPHDVPF